jgi:hypothetical protein
MKNIIIFVFISIALGSLSAQNFIGKVNPYPVEKTKSSAFNDTVKILAVMVEFQEDSDNNTFGNGKFGSMYSGANQTSKTILDPLPHDKTYFENHLEFSVNYFAKVSKGNQIVRYTVLDDIVTVSQTMRNYSPANNSDDLSLLGEFAQEVWQLADQMNSGIDFSNYNLFAVFHAGVGRDVNLPGSLGNERDLPSVYLSEKALEKIFGDSFAGFPVNNGTFNINNTAILPSTESRELSGIGSSVLLELSINGLIAATIGSKLGLPDLFDTETGLSAIGRFGLMDGQSIFAYGGTFPPEPSPWEKIYLGWEEPTIADIGDNNYEITANLASNSGDVKILKIPINQNEYFLVENRARDAGGDGSTVTFKVGSEIQILNFENDVDGYQSFDVEQLAGVITDVDDFDWALPGNGIVIWHIDESIIESKILTNTINNDKFNRGVDIEEADGIQDIGEQFTTIFGDEVIGEGSEQDFWFSSNDAELYENIFNRDSKPNTNSNTGGSSLISLSNFSDRSNRMTLNVKYGEDKFGLISTFKINSAEKLENITSQNINDEEIFYSISNDSLIRYNSNQKLNSFAEFSNFLPAVNLVNFNNNNNEYVFGAKDSVLSVYRASQSFDLVSSFDIGEKITCPPIINSLSATSFEVVIGTESGKIIKYPLDLNQSLDIDTSRKTIFNAFSSESLVQISYPPNGSMSAISGKSFWVEGESSRVLLNDPKRIISFYESNSQEYSVILSENNTFYVFKNFDLLNEFTISSSSDINSFILTDLFEDGNLYIIFNAGIEIFAYNFSGALADNFPISDPEGIGYINTPLAADLNSDNFTDIISQTTDGRTIVVSGATGSIMSPFPISSNGQSSVTPVIFLEQDSSIPESERASFIGTLSEDNYLSVWKIGDISLKPVWFGEFGNKFNSASISAPSSNNTISQTFFPQNRAYNWPNPVYGEETYIRYYVSENSNVEIKIFDLAGDLVDEITDNAFANVDNETVWNVSNVQSGVYYARLEVNGESGNSDQKIIKIAVIK